MCLAALGQIGQEATPLLPACLTDTQDSLGEPTPPLAVRPAAPLPPQDGMTQRPLGGIVRRLDSLVPHERPQLRLVGEQVTARRRRLGTAAGRSPGQCLSDLGPESADINPEAGPVQGSVSDSVPPGEHPVGQVQQSLPDSLPAVLPINHGLKVSTEVRPTKLATAEPVVCLPPIRGDDPPVSGTEQLPGDLSAAGGSNVEDRYQGRSRDP